MKRKRAGFTLIEVILVLAAFSTVTALAVPNLYITFAGE
jgi:prepilin-type N-terminal cleavage/methylation domain-containing protein